MSLENKLKIKEEMEKLLPLKMMIKSLFLEECGSNTSIPLSINNKKSLDCHILGYNLIHSF